MQNHRALYNEVKLAWSMCLDPNSWQDSYCLVMCDYRDLFASGSDTHCPSLAMRTHSLVGWLHHVNDKFIRHQNMKVEKLGWFYKKVINGHIVVFGDPRGISSLKHLRAKISYIPGVSQTRVDVAVHGKYASLTIFVRYPMLQAHLDDLIHKVQSHVVAENLGRTLAPRSDFDRYDLVCVDSSYGKPLAALDYSRYDLLELPKSAWVCKILMAVRRGFSVFRSAKMRGGSS